MRLKSVHKSLLKLKRSLRSIKIEFQAAPQPGTVTMQLPSWDGWTLIPSFNILHNARLMHSEFYRLGVFNGSLIYNAGRHHRYGRASIQFQTSSLPTKVLKLPVSMGTPVNKEVSYQFKASPLHAKQTFTCYLSYLYLCHAARKSN